MNNAAAIKALPDNSSSPSAMIRASQLPKELMTKIANLPTIVDTVCLYHNAEKQKQKKTN